MRDAREKLVKSNDSQDLFVPEGGSVATTTLTKLTEDYTKAQAHRIEVEAVSKQIGDMMRAGRSLDALPQMAADATFASLASQMAALNLERQRLKEKYKD